MKYQRFLALTLIMVASVGLATLAETFGSITGVQTIEDRLFDSRQRTTAGSFQAGSGDRESEVALVLFDELSVMDPVEGWPYLSPFPRKHLAELVDALSAAGAKTIGIDVFLDRVYPELNNWDGGDDMLRSAIERAGNVILVAPVERTDSGPVVHDPHPFFADVAADIGSAELPAAFETFRDGALAVRSGGRLEPSFALSMYAHARGFDVDSLLLQTRRWGRIPLDGLPSNVGEVPETWFEQGAANSSIVVPFRLRFAGPPSSTDAADPPGTYQATASSSLALLAMLAPEYFTDKIVLLGTGFHDSDKFRTPFYVYEPPPDSAATAAPEPYGWMFGVEVHANALQNMLDGEFVRPMDAGLEVLLLMAMALLTGIMTFWRGTGWGGATTLLAILAVFAGAWWAWAGAIYVPGRELATFDQPFLWIPVMTPLLAGLFSYFGTVGYVAVVEGKEKRFIQGAFGKYVSPDVVADLSNNPGQLQLGGQKRDLSILFSDLAGFTTLSERMDPQDLLAHLNEYLTEMTEVVMVEQGTLDKYIGDAIMAFWNAPRDVHDHADRALRAMVLSQRKMDELNQRWSQADPEHQELVVRIGVNTGEVVVGNVGGENRFDYSAIGDAVNLAARLEPANKSYDTLNMCSQFTLDAATASDFRIRELDLIAVKGKEEPVQVYEVLELAGVTLSDAKEKAVAAYDLGMAAYKKHDWTTAREHFITGLEVCPDDGPSRVYADRCAEHIEDPPPQDWDFVVRRTTK